MIREFDQLKIGESSSNSTPEEESPEDRKLRLITVYMLAGMIENIANDLRIKKPIYGGCYDEIATNSRDNKKILMNSEDQAKKSNE
jgi:hypothetical protein